MCPSSNDKFPCNRKPFLSEDGCDRGSVDVRQFDDFPYCKTIDPTPPEIPPEILDGPIPVPLPTYTCTCVDIKYKIDLGYNEKEREFSARGSFSAYDDCCEGNYETRFSLKIPCPVKAPGGRKIKIGISYGDGPADDSASFLNADSSSCTIEALSPELHLNIPCPIEPPEICAKLAEGVTIPSTIWDDELGRFKPLKNEELTYSYYVTGGTWRGQEDGPSYACARWRVEGPQGQYVEFRKRDCNPSEEIVCVEANVVVRLDDVPIKQEDLIGMPGLLEVYCDFSTKWSDIWNGEPNAPKFWAGRRETGVLHVGVGYGSGPQSASAKMVNTDRESCTISFKNPSINLNIPCPVKNYGKRLIKASIKYGSGSSSISASYASVGSDCSINLKDEVSLNLNLPCPVQEKGKRLIKASIKYGSGSSSISASYASVGSDCSITLNKEVRLGFWIPCPVRKKGKKKIKASIKYDRGSSSISVSYASVGSDCSISFKEEVTLNLGIPCPVREIGNRKIKARLTYGGQSSMSAAYASVDSGCKISLKKEVMLDIGMPCPTKKEFLSINPKLESHSGIWSFGESSSYNSNTCKRSINLNLRMPTAGFLGGMLAGFIEATRAFGTKDGKFVNQHYMFGRTTCTINDNISIGPSTRYFLKIDHCEPCEAEIVTDSGSGNTLSQTVIPLIETGSDGKIMFDFRGMPIAPLRE